MSPEAAAPPGADGSIEIVAPAKLNLGLRIVGRRRDGNHELEGLFVPIDLADRVKVECKAGDSSGRVAFRLVAGAAASDSDAAKLGSVPDGEANLAVRAARIFVRAAALRANIQIELEKRIPPAAGLGGGSSDAAAVLLALDRLFPNRLPSGELFDLALGLGADVPYFLDPKPALVGGIGERIEPAPGLPRLHFVLWNPGIPLATADVYAAYDAEGSALTPAGAGSTLRALLGSGADSEALLRVIEGNLRNDLEPAAVRLCPMIRRIRDRLEKEGARAVGMSGSGATVYGLFADAASARGAGHRMREEGPGWVRVAGSREFSGASPNR